MLVIMQIGRHAGAVLDVSFEAARALLLAGHARRPEYDARYDGPGVEAIGSEAKPAPPAAAPRRARRG